MRPLILAAALLLAAPTSSFAWGAAAHRFIMRQAIDLLPDEIKPFFRANTDELVLRSTDPDLWRTVGWEDDPNHFLNLGVPEFGAYPFAAIRLDFGAAVEKFGMNTLKKDGMLPWRFAEEFGNLRRAFEGFGQKQRYAPANAVLFTAVAGHYIQDAHEPLHATVNYDGQMTGQLGVHGRFESDLFDRFESRLSIRPAAAKPIADARETAFDVLLASYQLVDPLLAADKAASAGKDTYDDQYYETFFGSVHPILEQRLTQSIEQTAAVMTGAWQAAGRPVLRTDMPRRAQKVRKPLG